MKKIYIILTHSGTIMSKIVKFYTRYEYSHASISLDKDINNMYSFGRKGVYNIFNGGFTINNKNSKFYKRFKNTKCTILELEISDEQYNNLDAIIKKYKKNIDIYRYDILGVFLRAINIKINRKNYYYCTKFIKELLETSDIYNFHKDFVKPKDIMNIPNKKIIYTGKLVSY